jgi:hypothetical protein
MTPFRHLSLAILLPLALGGAVLRGQDYPNSLLTAPDTGRPYTVAPASFISAANYGISHGAGSISLSNLRFSEGLATFALNVTIDNWYARNSEGIFNEELWVEENDGPGWPGTLVAHTNPPPAVNVNSGNENQGSWSYACAFQQGLAPGTQFRVFGYCYMYNQGGGQQGEYALFSWMGPVTVPAPAPMTPPTSGNATIQLGVSWAPAVSGGEGSGPYVYCVAGATNFQLDSAPWTPSAAGTYTFYVGQLVDGTNVGNITDPNVGEMELNYSAYTLTVTPAPMSPPTSSDAAIPYGQSWAPSVAGGTGTGAYVYCVAGYTNYQPVTISWTPPAAGTYTFYVGQLAGAGYAGNVTDSLVGNMELNDAAYTLAVSPAPATFSASPLAFTYDGAAQGPALSASPSAATYSASGTVSAIDAGTYTFTVAAGGNYAGSASFTWTIVLPQYTLSTFANGNGTVTAGGTYPLNAVLSLAATPGTDAYFVDWTGDISGTANPLPVTITGNLSVTANFASLQAQTISFSPPANALFPSPALPLSASASSGLPVTFSVISGPGTLSGNQLALTGTGSVVVQAVQSGGAFWLPASAVTGTIQVVAVPPIARIRFNATGHDGRAVGGGPNGSSFLWTDPAGVQASPWPSFANPSPALPTSVNVSLPPVPPAPSGTD